MFAAAAPTCKPGLCDLYSTYPPSIGTCSQLQSSGALMFLQYKHRQQVSHRHTHKVLMILCPHPGLEQAREVCNRSRHQGVGARHNHQQHHQEHYVEPDVTPVDSREQGYQVGSHEKTTS